MNDKRQWSRRQNFARHESGVSAEREWRAARSITRSCARGLCLPQQPLFENLSRRLFRCSTTPAQKTSPWPTSSKFPSSPPRYRNHGPQTPPQIHPSLVRHRIFTTSDFRVLISLRNFSLCMIHCLTSARSACGAKTHPCWTCISRTRSESSA